MDDAVPVVEAATVVKGGGPKEERSGLEDWLPDDPPSERGNSAKWQFMTAELVGAARERHGDAGQKMLEELQAQIDETMEKISDTMNNQMFFGLDRNAATVRLGQEPLPRTIGELWYDVRRWIAIKVLRVWVGD